MKLLVSTLLFCCLVSISRAEDGQPKENSFFRYGVATSSFAGFNRNDAKAALKAWSKAILQEQQLNVQPELILFDNLDELRQSFVDEKLEAITLNVEQFLDMHLNTPYIFLPALERGLYIRYSVLVHHNSSIHSPADLKGRKIVSFTSADMVWSRLWLQALVNTYSAKSVTAANLKVSDDENPSKAVFQVYFNQADAALLPAETFNLACELNPQLQKDVKVLATSPPLITSVVVLRPSYSGETREKLENFLMEMDKSPHGRQVLTTFKRTRMERHPVSILEGTKVELEKLHGIEHIRDSGGGAL